MMLVLHRLIFIWSVAVLFGCSYSYQRDQADGTEDSNANRGSDVEWLMVNLFHNDCVGCHNSGRAAAGQNFETSKNLLASPGLVSPGNVGASKVYGVIDSGAMPPNGGKLTHLRSQEMLECWIRTGASMQGGDCLATLGIVETGTEIPSTPRQSPKPTPRPESESGDDSDGAVDGGGATDGGGEDDDEGGNSADDGNDDEGSDDSDDSAVDGSSDAEGNPPVDPITYDQVLNALVLENCEGCHSAEFPAQDISLSFYEDVMAVEGLVVPGNPSASMLYDVVATDYMPLNGTPISAELKALLYTWIEQGAKP